MMRESLRRPAPRLVDVLIVAVLLAAALPEVPWWWRPAGHLHGTTAILGMAGFAVVQPVPFLWRRRFPVAVLGVSITMYLIKVAVTGEAVSAGVAVLVAAYGIGAYGGPASRPAGRWLAAGAGTVAAFYLLHGFSHRAAAIPYLLLAAILILGEADRARRDALTLAVDAAHTAERTRIARELHDLLAHQLSAITVQSMATRLATQTAPDDGRTVRTLTTIEHLAREALTELGQLLGVLRMSPDDDPARRPAPSLAEIHSLLDTTRASGVPVDLLVTGTVRPLSPAVELSAYRIAQQALTNVVNHAPGARTVIELRYEAEHLIERISNERSPSTVAPARGGTGRKGLPGMRERAELHGGTFEAKAHPGGGFTVTASLPSPSPGDER